MHLSPYSYVMPTLSSSFLFTFFSIFLKTFDVSSSTYLNGALDL